MFSSFTGFEPFSVKLFLFEITNLNNLDLNERLCNTKVKKQELILWNISIIIIT